MLPVSSTWIPGWAGLTWVLVYAAIATWHLVHLTTMAGVSRLWHAAHVLMAAGMIDMFWPWGGMPAGPGAGEAVFAAAAVAAGFLALVTVTASRGRPVRGLWLLTAADLAVMVYMFALMSLRYLVVVTVLLAGWQLAEAAAWAAGRLGRGHVTGLRVSLALMSAGMAYMLLAMQFGMASAGHGGPGMPGMPGM